MLRVIGLCEGNPSVTIGFPSLYKGPVKRKCFQIWCRHHEWGCLSVSTIAIGALHDGVMTWKRFQQYCPFVRGFFVVVVSLNYLTSSPVAGHLRGNAAHMTSCIVSSLSSFILIVLLWQGSCFYGCQYGKYNILISYYVHIYGRQLFNLVLMKASV